MRRRWVVLTVIGLLAGCSGSENLDRARGGSDGPGASETSGERTAAGEGGTHSGGDDDPTDPATKESADTETDPPLRRGRGPEVGDHVHHAFAIQRCGRFEPAPTDAAGDLTGIHTHGDGIIHVHPFDESVAGDDATLGVFLDDISAEIDEAGARLPGGETIRAGADRCPDGVVEIQVAHWDDALAAAGGEPPDAVFTRNFDQIPLTGDLGAFTVVIEPVGAGIDPPPAAANICELALRDGGGAGDRCRRGG